INDLIIYFKNYLLWGASTVQGGEFNGKKYFETDYDIIYYKSFEGENDSLKKYWESFPHFDEFVFNQFMPLEGIDYLISIGDGTFYAGNINFKLDLAFPQTSTNLKNNLESNIDNRLNKNKFRQSLSKLLQMKSFIKKK
ncbi:hypothetical protein N9N67_12410, partial [Bacteriovoracaceae bacterium]|nr:hypothetical protein [Bacteriovoracaceae bacterium]